MTDIQVQLARTRIIDLRMRVASIADVLKVALAANQVLDDPSHARLQQSIRALQAVGAEFESVCDEQLSDLKNQSVARLA